MNQNIKKMPEAVGSERRISGQLLLYWNSIRKDRLFPTLEDVHPVDLGELWDDVFLLDIVGEGRFRRYVQSYLGTNVRSVFMPYQELLKPVLEPYFDQLISKRKPVFSFDQFEHPIAVKYRMVLLPLSSNDQRIDGILGGIRFKAA